MCKGCLQDGNYITSTMHISISLRPKLAVKHAVTIPIQQQTMLQLDDTIPIQLKRPHKI